MRSGSGKTGALDMIRDPGLRTVVEDLVAMGYVREYGDKLLFTKEFIDVLTQGIFNWFIHVRNTLPPEKYMALCGQDNETVLLSAMLATLLADIAIKRKEKGIPDEEARTFSKDYMENLTRFLAGLYNSFKQLYPNVARTWLSNVALYKLTILGCTLETLTGGKKGGGSHGS